MWRSAEHLGDIEPFRVVIPHCPEGGFYLYADAGWFTTDSQRWCAQLLEQQGVAVTPGADFGKHKAGRHVRVAYTTELSALRKAVERLARCSLRE